jgi:pimeloyl-ACP methyl ester carboxylesterase
MRSLSTSSREHERSAYGPVGHSPWLDINWRAHQRWVILDGQPLNVIELGEGPPLVFVHGLIGRWTHWMEQLLPFAADHRVIALDLPGFGSSPRPAAEKISISFYARMVEKLLAFLEIDAAAMVGHSMGGFTAVELAINHPQRVERLVLISPAGLSTYNDRRSLRGLGLGRRFEPFVNAYNAWVASNADTIARHPRLRLLEPQTKIVTRYPERLPAPFVAEFVRGLGNLGFIDGVDAILSYDYRDRLGEIACPTLIVWGERDEVVTARDALLYEELIPNSRKVIFPDTGHMAMIERPAAFNALLEEFLEEEPLSA